MKTHTIPESWVFATLGELCLISSGGTPDRKNLNFYRGKLPWVKSGELNYNTLFDTEEHINDEALQNSSAKIVPKDSVLVALYGATVGRLAILGIDAATNQAVAAIISPEGFLNKYLYFFLLHNKEQLLKQRQGGAQPNISQKILKDTIIPLPPTNDQQMIVAKIEELFCELDIAKKILKKTQKKLHVYKQATLNSAFNGKLTADWRQKNNTVSAIEYLQIVARDRKERFFNDKKLKKSDKLDCNFEYSQSDEINSWAVAKLDNLITIAGRVGWKGLKKEEYTKEGPIFLSVYSLNYGKYVSYADVLHISNERYEESPEIKLREDDILLCKDGSGIGKLAIIKNLPQKGTINSSILLIRAEEVFTPDFLYYLLSGPQMQKLVNERISGSAIPHLFQKDIREFILKIPPIIEQKQIVYEIEYRFTIMEKLDETIA